MEVKSRGVRLFRQVHFFGTIWYLAWHETPGDDETLSPSRHLTLLVNVTNEQKKKPYSRSLLNIDFSAKTVSPVSSENITQTTASAKSGIFPCWNLTNTFTIIVNYGQMLGNSKLRTALAL